MTEEKKTDAAAEKAVRLLGGPVKAARDLGVERYQTVQSWVTNGIPIAHCARVEEALGKQVTRQEMRPDDWQAIWPELVAGDLATSKA